MKRGRRVKTMFLVSLPDGWKFEGKQPVQKENEEFRGFPSTRWFHTLRQARQVFARCPDRTSVMIDTQYRTWGDIAELLHRLPGGQVRKRGWNRK